ncbi:hypothetical protein SAMN05444673_2888 [Bacillus sp. OV166]|uniref:hypothetical protein n=1 Tax=Bacillus sp. OV166 TaxID=1882763 RepID=UPI000A2AC8A6|nr:hypothetical protein [Bacillus sp. OV166]SMQ77554.1 hypothetical protein SAMN05444673_2888 [Bacillus sp. OV166]
MSKIQIFILSITLSILPWFLPTYVALAVLTVMGIIFFILLYRELKKNASSKEPYVYVGVGAVFLFLTLFTNINTLCGIFNSLFFIGVAVISHFLIPQVSRPDTSLTTSRKITKLEEEESFENLAKGFFKKLDEYIDGLKKQQQISDTNLLDQQETWRRFKAEITKEIAAAIQDNSKDIKTNFARELQKHSQIQNKELEAIMSDFKLAFKTNGDKIQQEVEQKIKERDKQTTFEIMELAIQSLQEKRINFSNSQHLENEQIKHKLYFALEIAKKDVYIQSPWLSEWLLSDKDNMLKYMREAITRGVNIHINYGMDENSSHKKEDWSRSDRSDIVARELEEKLKKRKNGDGTLFLCRKNSHYKLFICDEFFYVEGSYNVLSNKGNRTHEAAQYSEDKEYIKQLIRYHFTPK